jgi:LPXTG-site transpeptidase (sortase) family protein
VIILPRHHIFRAIAIILILAGAVVAGYPLWLKVQSGREQQRLEREFQEYEVNPAIPISPTFQDLPLRPDPPPIREPRLPQWTELPPTKLEIPAIGLEVQVVTTEDMGIFARKLSQPPSYYPQSAFPGEAGNVLIAGHRGGPAGYFQDLDELEPGDEIILHAPGVSYTYEVERVWIVEPSEVEVIAPLDYPALTLTTCQRVGKDPAAQRLIVRARLASATPTREEPAPPRDG